MFRSIMKALGYVPESQYEDLWQSLIESRAQVFELQDKLKEAKRNDFRDPKTKKFISKEEAIKRGIAK